MFVSSYNTYVQSDASQKTTKQRLDNSKSSTASFESNLSQTAILESKNIQNLPVNYISNYKAFSNKQKLQEQFESSDKEQYNKTNKMKNAELAYADNSKIFSLFLEPKATLNQTPQIDEELSTELQKLQEQKMRYAMVNTYITNDRYYQVTA